MMILRVVLLSLLLVAPTFAQQSAEELLNTIDRLYRSDSAEAKMTMTVVTPNWQREMSLHSWSQGMEKSFIRILSPRKDRGVSTLKIDDDMWNYFPKINKTIKVPPSMMSGSWMGSDFTNDDLVRESALIKNYDVSRNDLDQAIELVLVPKKSTVTVWGKITILVDADTLLPKEQAYYDDKGERVRVMTFTDIKSYGDKKLPSKMTMTPLNKSGHSTSIVYEQLKLDIKVDDSVFTQRNLTRKL